jgi:hypothetical protein
MSTYAERRNIAQKAADFDRGDFWKYCVRAASMSRHRALKKNVPHSIDGYTLDRLLVDQKWCCAVSGVTLHPPRTETDFHRDPLGPSLDRIIPHLGYVDGNVRIVSNIVNTAMNEWGAEALLELIDAIRGE